MLRDTFTEELGKLERFSPVNQRGKDVLVVRGAILDVVSHLAPQPATEGVDALLLCFRRARCGTGCGAPDSRRLEAAAPRRSAEQCGTHVEGPPEHLSPEISLPWRSVELRRQVAERES